MSRISFQQFFLTYVKLNRHAQLNQKQKTFVIAFDWMIWHLFIYSGPCIQIQSFWAYTISPVPGTLDRVLLILDTAAYLASPECSTFAKLSRDSSASYGNRLVSAIWLLFVLIKRTNIVRIAFNLTMELKLKNNFVSLPDTLFGPGTHGRGHDYHFYVYDITLD